MQSATLAYISCHSTKEAVMSRSGLLISISCKKFLDDGGASFFVSSAKAEKNSLLLPSAILFIMRGLRKDSSALPNIWTQVRLKDSTNGT